jgi:hypothetical protein
MEECVGHADYREVWEAGFDRMDERLRSGEDVAGDG